MAPDLLQAAGSVVTGGGGAAGGAVTGGTTAVTTLPAATTTMPMMATMAPGIAIGILKALLVGIISLGYNSMKI